MVAHGRRLRGHLARTIVAAVVAACGGGGAPFVEDAAAPDAAPVGCPVPEGTSFVLARIRFMSTGGFDLDGDGDPDNEIGKLPAPVLDSTQGGIDTAILNGELIVLIHITEWSDPPTPTDPDLTVYAFIGYDADEPANPGNNYGGEGRFLVRPAEFDVNCGIEARFESASIEDRVLTMKASRLGFPLSTHTGSLEFVRMTLITELDPEYRSGEARAGAVTTLCALHALPFPGDTPGSALDAFVNDPTLSQAVSPDIDMDGDGIEQVIGDGITIERCIDGDGTVVPGRDCPCHPAIADGYSLLLDIDVVSATIVGAAP